MKKTILYIYPSLSTFIQKDIAMLKSKYNVIVFEFNPKKKFSLFPLLIYQFFFLLLNIRKSKTVLCKFSSYHSFFPLLLAKVFRKPSVLINGGTDCVSFPSINYGNFSKLLQGKFTAWSYKLASQIVTLHKSLIEYNYTYQKSDFPKQGFAYHVRNISAPITEIYNGYDFEKWKKTGRVHPNSFLTVAFGIGTEKINYLKGIDLLLKAANEFPNCTFYLVGATESFIQKYNKGNIVVSPPVKNSELLEFFSKSEFYLQLSISEGFPNSLSEAMLCECIPIVSDVGAMPFIIGESGFILKNRDEKQLVKIIEMALKSDKKKLQIKARAQIKTNFTEERRKEKLIQLIESL